ncbi:methyl-CpG-binding domain protein 3-like 2B [Glossophaga mutica]
MNTYISPEREEGEDPSELKAFISYVIQTLNFIVFSKGNLKRNMMPQTLEKKRRFLSETKRRHHKRSELPVRQTSCIFKRPVTKITSHAGNKVWRKRQEKTLEKPQQVCAYRRLQGLQACSSEGEPLSTLDVMNTMNTIAQRSTGGSLGGAGPGSVCTSPEPTTAWSSDWAEVIPGAGLCVPQLLCKQPVTRADIRRQTQRVKKARERLALALREDGLAREAERARSPEEHCEN